MKELTAKEKAQQSIRSSSTSTLPLVQPTNGANESEQNVQKLEPTCQWETLGRPTDKAQKSPKPRGSPGAGKRLESLGRHLLCGFMGSSQSGSQNKTKAKDAKIFERSHSFIDLHVSGNQKISDQNREKCRETSSAEESNKFARRTIGSKGEQHKVKLSSSCGQSELQISFNGSRSMGDQMRDQQTGAAEAKRHQATKDLSPDISMGKLIETLDQLTRECNFESLQMDSNPIGDALADDGDSLVGNQLELESNWTQIVDPNSVLLRSTSKGADESHSQDRNEKQVQNLRLQQDAIWELVTTEVHYIKCLKVIVDIFCETLERLQDKKLLLEVDGRRLFSNVKQILQANLKFWSHHIMPMLSLARSSKSPLDPIQMRNSFSQIRYIFSPYYNYCLELTNCLSYVKELVKKDESFRIYLAWCESQRQCERLKLTDLLAKPMQRLTRYPLLLKAIQKRTDDQVKSKSLELMLAYTNKFVHTVDLELRRKEERDLLWYTIRRVDCTNSELSSQENRYNEEICNILKQHKFDLSAPLFSKCEFQCNRQLLFDSQRVKSSIANSSSFKFRDTLSSTKLDVVLLIFTDCLLICKQVAPSAARSTQTSAAGHSKMLLSPTRHRNVNRNAKTSPNHMTVRSYPEPSSSTKSLTNSALLSPRTHSLVLTSDLYPPGESDLSESSGNSSRDSRVRSMSASARGLPGGDLTSGKSEPIDEADYQNTPSFHLSNISLIKQLTSGISMVKSRNNSTNSENLLAPNDKSNSIRASYQSLAASPNDLQQQQTLSDQPTLRCIRGPFPIERLVTHELGDGLAVLVCQLNDNHTVANSFIIYCGSGSSSNTKGAGGSRLSSQQRMEGVDFDSSRSDSESFHWSDLKTELGHSCDNLDSSYRVSSFSQSSPARRLINIVTQAQVRYQLAANFHNVTLNTISLSASGHHSGETMTPKSVPRGRPSGKYHFSALSLRHPRSRSIGAGSKKAAQHENNLDASSPASKQNSSDNAFSDTQLDPKSSQLNRRSISGERPSIDLPGADSKITSTRHKADLDPLLKAIIDQHQLMMLNHEQSESLATHEYRYPVLNHNYLKVRPVAISLEVATGMSHSYQDASDTDIKYESFINPTGHSLREARSASQIPMTSKAHLLSPHRSDPIERMNRRSNSIFGSDKQLTPNSTDVAIVYNATTSSSSSTRSSPINSLPARVPFAKRDLRSSAKTHLEMTRNSPERRSPSPYITSLSNNYSNSVSKESLNLGTSMNSLSSSATRINQSPVRRNPSVLRRQKDIISASSDHHQESDESLRDLGKFYSYSSSNKEKEFAAFKTLSDGHHRPEVDSRRNQFIRQHHNQQANRTIPSIHPEASPSTGAELVTNSTAQTPSELMDINTDDLKANSFELGQLYRLQMTDNQILKIYDNRSCSMESGNSPVSVTLTVPNNDNISPSQQICITSSPELNEESSIRHEQKLLDVPRISSSRNSNNLNSNNESSQNRRDSLSPLGWLCDSTPTSIIAANANGGSSQRDKYLAVATSNSSISSISATSTSFAYLESDSEQTSGHYKYINFEACKLSRCDIYDLPSDYPEALGFQDPSKSENHKLIDRRRPSSTSRLDEFCLSDEFHEARHLFKGFEYLGKEKESSQGNKIYLDNSSRRCKESLWASERFNRNLSQSFLDRQECAHGSVSAEHLNLNPSNNLLDVGCISELVRDAELDKDGNLTLNSYDELDDNSSSDTAYLGFHEKLERHQRQLEAEKQDTNQMANDQSNNLSESISCRWPLSKFRQKAQPLKNVKKSFFQLNNSFSRSSKKSSGSSRSRRSSTIAGTNTRGFSLTRSMTSELFESLLKVSPLRSISLAKYDSRSPR